jgi:hypothetical protein
MSINLQPASGAVDDVARAATKGAAGAVDDVAVAATKSVTGGILKRAGQALGPALAFGAAEYEAREAAKAEGTTVGAQRGKQYAGAAGSIAAGIGFGALVGGPAAPVTALVGGIAAAFLRAPSCCVCWYGGGRITIQYHY